MPTIDKPVKAPAASATGDKTLKPQDFRERKLVIYFYPKDNTPGCTREAQGFRDLYPQFQDAGCEVLGVSRDSVRTHENFRAKHDLPFDLVADVDESWCEAFDVIKEKNMYGRKVMGIERSTFLLDAKGILRREWRKVRVPGHVEDVLEAVRGLD